MAPPPPFDDGFRFGRRVRPTRSPDLQLTARVITRLLGDPRLEHERITIEVQNRVVTLLGTVSSLYARVTAADLARSTPGVTDICNRLRLARAADVTALAADPFDDLVAHWRDERPARPARARLVAAALTLLAGRRRRPAPTPGRTRSPESPAT
jgi:hypothetical protein